MYSVEYTQALVQRYSLCTRSNKRYRSSTPTDGATQIDEEDFTVAKQAMFVHQDCLFGCDEATVRDSFWKSKNKHRLDHYGVFGTVLLATPPPRLGKEALCAFVGQAISMNHHMSDLQIIGWGEAKTR